MTSFVINKTASKKYAYQFSAFYKTEKNHDYMVENLGKKTYYRDFILVSTGLLFGIPLFMKIQNIISITINILYSP